MLTESLYKWISFYGGESERLGSKSAKLIVVGSTPTSILKEIFYMDCGAPRIEGPMAKKIYEYMMKKSEEAKTNKESREEKRKKRLEEFEEQMKKKQRP